MRAPPLDWVTVPAGPFTMGAYPAQRRAGDAAHRRELPAFWVTRAPVTNAQYAAFTAATGHPPPAHWEGAAPPVALAEHPVTYVDWRDAGAFCAWAGGRLPSEAEWEKAARGPDGRPYPWGDAPPDPLRCNFGGQLGATTPVGRYAAGASPYGLLDMAGNVWEWTATLHRPYPYRADDGREEQTAAGRRVLRGGSYQHGPPDVRCAARGGLYPDACDVYIGFRVAAEHSVAPLSDLDWVMIPAGPFVMGEQADAPGEGAADPQLGLGAPPRRLALALFDITRTPVTNAQYAAFTAATGRRPPGHWEGATPPAALRDHPVTYVDWRDAGAFCAWAGGRLPSEAEWEKAARGPDGRPYPWGDAPPDAGLACFERVDDPVGTWPVGSRPAGASPYGLLDMAGNVWEWTATLHRPYPYRADDGREEQAAAGRRVLRGGSCRSEHARYLHCAFRSLSYPARRRDHIGFRVARSAALKVPTHVCEQPAPYGLLIARDVMLPMRDGVRLAADIYRPALDGEAAPGVFPTILLRTSYDKGAQRYVATIAEFFTPQGFVTVQQDLRGRYASEGAGQYRHTANLHEGMDGYDTIEWIAAQPWSNGRVGMVGSSHPGLVQTHAALYRPPHLTAIWPDVAPTNSYAHQVRMGGAMQLHMFGALFLHAQDSQQALADPQLRAAIFAAMGRMRELVYATPFKPGHTPLSAIPELEQTLFDYYTRGACDAFWAAEFNDFERQFARHADLPGTFSGGWFDPYASATTGHYAAMAAQSTSPQRLIMGPWTHMGIRIEGERYVANDVDFGPAAAWGFSRFNAEQLRWFGRWLRDEPTGVEQDPPVQLFVMGGGSGRRTAAGHLDHGGRWRAEQEWPLARAVPTALYLQPGGGLGAEPGPADAPPARFRYDPAHPVPTVGGPVTGFFEFVAPAGGLDPFWARYLPPWTLMRSIIADGPAHQQPGPATVGAEPPYLPLSMRPDLLVFQTPPLPADVEVTGPIEVRLFIASSAPDTDFTAKLIDVYPPNPDYPEGYHMYLGDGIIRCRYREGFEGEALLEPGQIYAVTISLAPTSNLFKAGHRIRLDISSSNFPRFDLNPNTGEPMGRHTRTQPADNTVFADRDHPSRVVLPVIPT